FNFPSFFSIPILPSLPLTYIPSCTYLTHEAKGSDDAPDADTAIINAEGGQPGGDDKKEYFI
uniref:Uncharacterized protein n=1 Tax=Laticauda laticaudata TaxID=8630 RepID=A0A8C5SKH9_LATLA